MKASTPRVSLILCAYKDEATIGEALRRFSRQTYPDFEIVVVDSSPGDGVEKIVEDGFPEVVYQHWPSRLFPNDAHAIGVDKSSGELLVFSDPGIYAPAGWLDIMVEAWSRVHGPVGGSIDCYGNRWLDLGIHLGKFDPVLPGGSLRPTGIAPTSVLLCERRVFLEAGGFVPGWWLADTLLNWQLLDRGYSLYIAPEAVVEHHHRTTISDYLGERLKRGREFGLLRASREAWTVWQRLVMAALSVSFLRLVPLLGRTVANAWKAPRRWSYLSALPIAAMGHAVWLLGETWAYLGSAVTGTERG
jgi:glycosyltransferase involved in cell wall biosynthesis